MQTPATPDDFKDLIVKESDTFCTALLNLMKLSVLVWKMTKFKYTIGGTFTSRYRQQMCAIICAEPDETTP